MEVSKFNSNNIKGQFETQTSALLQKDQLERQHGPNLRVLEGNRTLQGLVASFQAGEEAHQLREGVHEVAVFLFYFTIGC